MITPKQRAKLKKISHGYKPLVNIGKGGISENTLKQIDDTLNKREVMKIRILTIYRESENKVIDLDD